MAKLTEAQKLFIVEHIACFDSPLTVAKAFKEEFDVEIERWQVEEYDPSKRHPAKKWVEIFAAIRNRFLKDVSVEPAARKTVRVRRLARMAQRSEDKGNIPLARELYEQIAKEVGDAYTNRRVIVPSNALEELAKTLDLTPEQLSVTLGLSDGTAVMATDGSDGTEALT